MSAEVRFWNFVKKKRGPNACWEWTGQLQQGSWHSTGGYGRLKVFGRTMLAHRISYALHYGEVPEGMDVDHLCNNRKCVNPKHLEATTHQENVRRIGVRARERLTRDELINV